MTELAIFLWRVFLVFALVCLAFCVESFLRYRHKRGIDDDHDFHSRYDYFGQPVYNQNDELYGYELLLREFNRQTRQWQLPHDVVDFPLSKMVETIQRDVTRLKKVRVLALNMTVSQLIDFRAEYFFSWVLGLIGDTQLTVEIGADDIMKAGFFRRRQLLRIVRTLRPSTVQFTIENIDSSRQTYIILRQYLPYVNYAKVNIHAFKKSENHWIDITLAQWQRRAKQFGVTVAASKVEISAQVQLLNQLNIGIRQGYAYGGPQRLEEAEKETESTSTD